MPPSLALALLAAVAGCGHPAAKCVGVCVAPSLTTLDLLAGQPGGSGSVDGVGAAVHFTDPWTFAGDGAGTLYIADGSMIRRIDEASATVTTIAGSPGVIGAVDAVGPAAQFYQPGGLALDGGTLYVSDTENHCLRAVDLATATVTTFAGALNQPGTDDGDRLSARFREPEGIALDGAGNLYVADTDNHTIRQIVLSTGAVTTIAGTVGVSGAADGVGLLATLDRPKALAFDGAGHLFIVDNDDSKIRRLTLADGTVSTLATFSLPPAGIASDGTNLWAALGDDTVARIDPAGNVTVVAGTASQIGFADGSGAAARFAHPGGLWLEGGRLFVADNGNYAVRAVEGGAVTTVLGAISAGTADGSGADARFFAPQGFAVDSVGANLYVADTDNHTIRKVALDSGAVTTLAGAGGQAAYADGNGSDARFNTPTSVALDEVTHTLYIADAGNRSIRTLDIVSGAVATLPTNGAPGSMFARFNSPSGMAEDATRLYVSDSGDHVIVAIDRATYLVTVLAGSPRVAGASDGSGAAARFNAPSGLAVDGAGALYVADVLNDAVRKIDLTSGAVSTVAGVLGLQGGDDGSTASARFYYPTALAIDGLGDLFVGDSLNGLVRHVDLKKGVVSTVIGILGDPGVRTGPLPAQLGQPTALVLTPDGHLVVASENALLLAH